MFQRLVFVTSILCFATDAIPLSEKTLSNLELVQIPLADGKELGLLSLTDENGRLTERNKRTIGILRDLFPELTEQVDQSVNKLVSQLIRVVGPAVLRGAVRNNQNTINSRTNFDTDFDDSQENTQAAGTSSTGSVRIELPTFDESPQAEDEKAIPLTTQTTTEAEPVIGSNREKRDLRRATQIIVNERNTSIKMLSSKVPQPQNEKSIFVTTNKSLNCNPTERNNCSNKNIIIGHRNNLFTNQFDGIY